MTPLLPASLSSVTRWLLVVVGCAVLETAQPMNAAETPPAPAPSSTLDADRVLYPADSRPRDSAARDERPGGAGPAWVFVVLVGLGAGAFWLWRRRHPAGPARRSGGILIEDTRSLGNRQFLVVASVEGRRFLLGVAPGNIRLVAPLDSDPSAEDAGHDA